MKNTFRKRIVALLILITLLPFDSFVGCFPAKVQADEVQDSFEKTEETIVNTVSDGDAEGILYSVSSGDAEYYTENELNNTVSSGDAVVEDNVVIKEILDTKGFRLTEDITISGDYCLTEGTLDLDGFTLTIQGDFIHTGGTVNVNGGELIVKGNYRMQSRTGEEGSYTYGSSSGILQMTDASDYVLVKGSYLSDSSVTTTGHLTAGVLEIKGDMVVSSTYSQKSFVAEGSHKVLLSGEGKQTVDVSFSYKDYTHVSGLEIANSGEEGVVFKQELHVAGEINDHGSKLSGSVRIGDGTSFTDNYYGGNISVREWTSIQEYLIIGGDLTISMGINIYGNIHVKGDCNVESYGRMYMKNGSLEVDGNYSISGDFSELEMTNAEDYIYVRGNAILNPEFSCDLTAGTFEIGGDLTSSKGIYARENHRFLFSGDKKQTISIVSNEYFATIELQNYSEFGVYSATVFKHNTLVRNGCRLNYGDMEGEYGWTLTEDQTYEGDLMLIEDTLDLNGHTLTVTGDLVQVSGTVKVNGGQLIVEGNYRMQSRTGKEGAYTYGSSNGILQMTDASDYVLVKGSYLSDSSVTIEGHLTAGVLEIKGDMIVSSKYSQNSFVASGIHQIILSGDNMQTVDVSDSSATYCRLSNLEISNSSTNGVDFKQELYVSGEISDYGNQVRGTLCIGDSSSFTNNYFGGNIRVSELINVKEEIEICGNLLISQETNIYGKIYVQGNCIIEENGKLCMQGGSLVIDGNFTMDARQTELSMTNAGDYIHVNGNVVCSPQRNSSLTAGTFEIGGDFTTTRGIMATDNHRFLFSGDSKQTISMASNEYFATIELQNYSEEGVYSATSIAKTTLVRNGCRLVYGDSIGEYGWILMEDQIYEGDLVLVEDVLDLNGYTLTVTGDLVQVSGVVWINGGQLIVEGDYRIQSRAGEEGAYVYGRSNGILQMSDESDYVLVQGSFFSDSPITSTGNMIAGIMEIRGNILIGSEYGQNIFSAEGTHKLLLSGEGRQTVDVGRCSICVAGLEITNSSVEGVVFNQEIYASGEVNDHGNKISGTVSIGSTTSFANNSFGGNVSIRTSLDISKQLIIGGNLYISKYAYIYGSMRVMGNCIIESTGRLYIPGGTLEVEGNFTVNESSTEVYMNNTESYICVKGNVVFNPSRSSLTAGTFEIGGNLTSIRGIAAVGNHRFLFSGDGKQTISVAPDEYFAAIELQNYSEEGVYSDTSLTKTSLVRNGCRLTYGDMEGEFGWTLAEDQTYEGDLVLIEDTLDLNGYTLTVTGDLVQVSGTVKINGGQLIVEGNYRMQSRKGEEGSYTYGNSSGILQMTDASDYVLVKGSYLSDSSVTTTGHLTAGVLEIKGDMVINSTYSKKSFVAGGSHKVLLSGDGKQTVDVSYSRPSYVCVAELEITNSSEDGILLKQELYVTGEVNDHRNKVSGTLGIGYGTSFADNYYGGNISIKESVLVDKSICIGGNMTAYSSINIHGNLHVKGDCILQYNGYVMMNGGSLEVDGNCLLTEKYSAVFMTHAEDYICVRGDVEFGPYYYSSLSAGTFEVGGNLTSTTGLKATGGHRFLFSGDSKQTISIAPDGYFATVELQNYSEKGVYSDTVFKRTTLIRNGCRLTYGDVAGEFGWTLQDDQIYEGDLLLMEDTLDLNGYTLTVTGDFVQMSGIVDINGGQLIVEGDYRIQSRSGAEGAYTYGTGSGQLIMQEEADKVTVYGDFVMNTSVATQGKLTAGVMEVQGNFLLPAGAALQASGDHTVVFTGKKTQTWNQSVVPVMANVINRSEKALNIIGTPIVAGSITDEKNNIGGNGYIKLNSANRINGGGYSGTLCITGSDTLVQDIKVGSLMVANGGQLYAGEHSIETGAITLDGSLYVQNGEIICEKNFTVNENGRLYMQDEAGYVLVNGNFDMNSNFNHSGSLTAGTLEIRGDFTQRNYVNFVASEEHVVILSRKLLATGENTIQNISFNHEAGTTRFNKLVLRKYIDDYYFKNGVENIANEIIYDLEDEVPPTAVTTLEVMGADVTSITLSYGGATDEYGILGYNIYRDGVCVAVTNETTYTDQGLLPSTEYTYEVYAFDLSRNVAEESPQITAETGVDVEAPATPQGLSVYTRTGSSITLTWNGVTDNAGVDSYTVYRNGKKVAEGLKETNYKDAGLIENTVYRYYVVAIDVAGNASDASKTLEALVAMPEITEVTPADYSGIGGDKVTLTAKFKNVGNATGNNVKIEYMNDKGEWVMLSPANLSQKEYNGSTLYVSYTWNISKLNGDYEVRYTLYDADRNTDVVQALYHIDREAPEQPENLQAVTDNGVVMISWDASKSGDCSYYKLYRREADSQEYTMLCKLTDRYDTTYTDNQVTEGQCYSYAVLAGDSFYNESAKTEDVTVEVDKDLAAPRVETMTPKAGKIGQAVVIKVTATDNRKVSAIRLQYKEADAEEWLELTEVSAKDNAIEYTWDTSVLTDGIYMVRAIAKDAGGNESTEDFSRRYEVDNTGIAKIEITDYTVSATGVRIHWADVTESDFAYFQVEQIQGKQPVKVATVSDVLGYEVGQLTPDTTYAFQVVGYDNLGNRGIPSETITITTKDDTLPPTIEGVYPVASYYRNSIPLQVRVQDNYAVAKAVFSYSVDGEVYEKIAEVEADTHSVSDTLSTNFDISSFPEGKIYVKFEAYDAAGNKNALLSTGEDIIVEYIIDRTAPAAVEGVSASGNNGYVELNWNMGTEQDIKAYRIYRADSQSGSFRVLQKECTTKNYYDTDVEPGQSYIYKISAVDIAGNESELSAEMFATVGVDKERPVITGLSPSDGSAVGYQTVIKALAVDNAKLAELTLEYLAVDSEQEIWTTIKKLSTEERSYLAEVSWNTEELTEGEYYVRAMATDMAGNVSDIYQVTYTIDHTAPKKPKFSAQTGHFQVILEIEKPQEADFAYYEIYRRTIGEEDDRLLAKSAESTYVDATVTPNTVYAYTVAVYDKCGNVSRSEEVEGYADDIDVVAPIAVLPENLIGLEGMELAFDGMGSSDNVRITDYRWNMGNGVILTGPQPVYTYEKAGTYVVTLEVSDAAGNTAQTSTTVRVYEKDGRGTATVRIVDENGNAIPYALVYVQMKDGEALSLKADSNGYVTIAATTGAHNVAAYASGYLPDDIEVLVSEYETREHTLTLVQDELIVGSLTVRRMTLEEMVEAGVDFSDPENYNRFVFNVKLTFKQCPLPVEIEYVTGSSIWQEIQIDNVVNDSESQGGGSNHTLYVRDIVPDIAIDTEEEIPILTYVSTTQSVSWLKEMYEVELGILNAADTKYVIEDSVAHLNLPEGVSLAKTKTGQSLTQSMGDIRGQEVKTASWVVKGDESGKYKLSASFEGMLMPFNTKVSAFFETEKEFEVSTGEGLHIYVMPENRGYDGSNYYIQFAIRNESGRTFYNLTTSFGTYRVPDYETTITDIFTGEKYTFPSEDVVITDPSSTNQSVVVHDGQSLTFTALEPGDVYYGTYVTTFTGAEENKEDEEDVYYKLIESLVTVLEGENTGVQVHVMPIESHIYRGYWGYMEVPSLYGDPIDMGSGYFADEVTAFSIAGANTVNLDMRYTSGLTDKKGALGYGWYHDYEMRLEQRNGIVYFYPTPYSAVSFVNKSALEHSIYGSMAGGELILAEGAQYSYGEYTCISRDMKDCLLVRNTDGTYTMSFPNTSRYDFDAEGRLVRVTDTEAKTVSLIHEGNRTVIREDISGRQMYLNYNSEGLISTITDDNGRQTVLSYDTAGRLTSLTGPAGESLYYTYDEKNRMVQEANAQGTFVTNEYDEADRVVRQTDAMGGVTTLSYEEANGGLTVTITDANGAVKQAVSDRQGRILKQVNENGAVTEYTYDSDGNVVCEKDAYGNCIFMEYDANGNLTKLTDTGNLTTTMTYDAKGNVATITNESGQTARYTYNSRNQVVTATDFAGATTTYQYNENGQVTVVTAEGLGSMTYTYENGMVSSVTDYLGNTTHTTYDGMGNLVKTVDALGNTVTYTYDRAGRMVKETDALGNTTRYTYDCNGNVSTMTDAEGGVTTYSYDAAGRQTGITYPDGTTMKYEYDAMGYTTGIIFADGTRNTYICDGAGNVVKEILADGTEYTYTYDLLNQKIAETDGQGRTVKYEYYPNGNPYKVTYPDETYELYTYNEKWRVASYRNTAGYTTSYEYDAMSNLTMARDALGNTWRYEYDVYGRLVKETDANGNSTTYRYDANGNCIEMTNAVGTTVYMEYDVLCRLTGAYMKDQAGEEYRAGYTYDALGGVSSVTDELGNTSTYTYDAKGNVVSVTNAEGVTMAVSAYDAMGRVTSATDALGLTTTYSYDVMGNLLSVAEQLNSGESRTTAYAYDTLGRVTQVTDPLEGVTKACYDGSGNISSITDANGGTTEYTYDTMGRLLTETTPIGSVYSYSYNAQGLLSELENARGQQTTYTYDAIGRVTSMTDELGTVSYTYDNNGNVLTVSDEKGTITRKYDALNRVTEYTDYKGNTVKYAYDELGNLISLTYPGGEIVRYTYYKNGLLHTATDASGNVTSYEYDVNGNLTRTVRPNGTEELCTYNAAGLLVEQKEVKGEEVLSHYTYTYDGYGNITAIEGTEATDTQEGISHLIGASMTYDAGNRLLTYNGEALQYDADGNMTYGPVDGVMSELVYDCRNRLISAGGVTYTYDAENNRISAETADYIEEYVTDMVSASLSRVLTMTVYEKTAGRVETAGTTTTYLYGQGLISEQTGDLYLYHHYNHLGSTMLLTDAEGNVVETYTYGVYGELLSGDESLTRFLYNGRCGVSTDDNGLYYMRQRYYNPEIKRFVNQDILAGSLGNSQSLNRYSYVQGNPVSYTDPFGLSPSGGLFSNTNFAHSFFGLLSCVPGIVGACASLADGLVYALVDKDYAMAGLCALDVVSMGLGKFATNLIKGQKMTNTGVALYRSAKLMSNVSSFGQNAIALNQNVGTILEKWDSGVSASGTDFLALGMSVFGCAISGGGILHDVGQIRQMRSNADFMKGLQAEKGQFICDIKSSVKGGTYCFVAGTQIHTDDGTVAIEDICPGDYVLSYNEETGETAYKRVVQLFRNTTEELAHVQVEGTEEILCTPGHKFYVEGEWISAEDLEQGDILTAADGTTLEVISVTVEKLETPVNIYNFEVEDWHNYYVADSGVLVHNMNCAKLNEAVANAGVGGSKTVTVGDNNQSIVYRVIRSDENPVNGLTAINPTRGMTIEGHIATGSRNKGSQFISTTTDINVANKYALQDGCRIVEIDLNKLPSNVKVYDLSTVVGRDTYLKGVTAKNFAAKSSEVLLEGYIPSEAISLR